jgi:hypothetical protein
MQQAIEHWSEVRVASAMGAETAAINKKSAAQSERSLANRDRPDRIIGLLSYYKSRLER